MSRWIRLSKTTVAWAAAMPAWLAASAVQASVTFYEGHQQVGHAINMDAAAGVAVLTGHVQTQSIGVEFKNATNAGGAIDPAANPTNGGLHASNGVSKLEACNPCAPPSAYADAPFRSIEMWVEPGWGFTDMDWALTPWDPAALDHDATTLEVTFTAFDQFGTAFSHAFSFLDENGKDKWHFHTTDGQVVTKLVISSTVDIHHLEQMTAQGGPIPAPEPGTLSLAALALVASASIARRRT